MSVGVLDGSAPFPSGQIEGSPAASTPGAGGSAANALVDRDGRTAGDEPRCHDDDWAGRVTIVAVCAASGSAASTTTSVALAAMLPAGYPTLLAECDPSGGDVASWAQLSTSPGWSTAVSAATDLGRRSPTTRSSCRPGSL